MSGYITGDAVIELSYVRSTTPGLKRLQSRLWHGSKICPGCTGVDPVEALSSWAAVDAVALNSAHEDDLQCMLGKMPVT